MDKTAKKNEAKQSITKDSTLKDLQDRYNMDATIWQASKRGFPFNIPFYWIVVFALSVPLGMSVYMFDKNNTYLWKCYLLSLAMSIVAYFISDKAIEQFMKSLEDRGLFGKDLNKAGQRETKPKV
jgi:hypothetical protein